MPDKRQKNTPIYVYCKCNSNKNQHPSGIFRYIFFDLPHNWF